MANNKLTRVNSWLCMSILLFSAALQAGELDADNYKLTESFHLNIDDKASFIGIRGGTDRQIIVGHGKSLSLFDQQSLSAIGTIALADKPTAMTTTPNGEYGFVSLTKANTLQVVDLKKRSAVDKIKTPGSNPGKLLYDNYSHNIYAADTKKPHLVSVNPKHDKHSNIAVSGKVSSLVTNHRGHIFASIAGKPGVEVIDTEQNISMGLIPLLGCNETTGLDIDSKERRLFVACANGSLHILDTDTGYELNRLPIGQGGAEVALSFEPNRIANIYTLAKDGSLTIGAVKKVTFSNKQTINGLSPDSHFTVSEDSKKVLLVNDQEMYVYVR